MATDTQDADTHPALEDNRLLAALTPETRDRLAPGLELVQHELKEMLLEQAAPIEYVYFPHDSVISLLSRLEVGRPVEVATTGYEGMVGLPVYLNAGATSAYMAFAQVSGRSWRMPVAKFRAALADGGDLHDVLQRYTQALFGQLAVNVACNRAHAASERLPRWLLMSHDRARRDTFPLTQEFMAQMLGVRRATANQVARSLQERGLIAYSRGQMTIADREGLEAAACECYRRVNQEFEQLFPP